MKTLRFAHPLALSLWIALLALAALYLTALPTLAQSDDVILSGRVTSDVEGSPVPNVQIQLIDPYFPGVFDVAITDSSGRYTVTESFLNQFDIVTATFKVRFQSGGMHLSEYYDNTDTLEEASLVTLTTNAVVSGIDASLALGGQISGQVLSAESNQPLDRMVLALYTPAGEPVPEHSFITADDNGSYDITGIVSGTYKLGVRPADSDSYYVGAYYPNTQWLTEAQPIQVATGVYIDNVDFALTLGGHITGTVTSSNHRIWPKPLIEVYDDEGRLVPSRITLSQQDERDYTLSHLLPGNYRLLIRDEYEVHWPEYYDNQTELGSATLVTVTAGAVTGNVNAELALIPRVAGIATSSALSDTLLLSLWYNPIPVYTTNGGQAWQQVSTAPWVTENSISPPNIGLAPRTEPGLPTRMLVAAADDSVTGLYRTGDNGQSWAQQTFPPEQCSGSTSFFGPVASPTNPARLYLVHTCIIHMPFGGSLYNSRLLISRDAGISWQESGTFGGPSNSFTSQVIPSPVIAERVYAHGSYPQRDNATWLQSDDGGGSWSAREFPVFDLVLDAEDAARAYGISPFDYSFTAPRYGKRSDNGGEQWVNWAQQPCDLGQPGTEDTLLQLMAHPARTQVLFLRCDQGLFRSENGGDSWTELASTPGQLLAPDYGTPGRILWGKNDGLWASMDSGDSWQQIMPNYTFSSATDAQVPLYLPSISINASP
ncbi:MAG: hypothetical protein IT328_23225 [Caldilineaceae bacterium]|nr:hypothetical protein [Caldilineaceae bacterium]